MNGVLSNPIDPKAICGQNTALSGFILLFIWGLLIYYVLGKIFGKIGIHIHGIRLFVLGLAVLEIVLWTTNMTYHWWSVGPVLIPFFANCPVPVP